MIGISFSEFIEDLYIGHEFEFEYKGEEYTLMREFPNKIKIFSNSNDDIFEVFEGNSREDVIDKFLNSSSDKKFNIQEIEKDIKILYVL